MTRLVGSELFKLRTTRTFYGLTLISLGLILVIVILVSALVDFQPDEEVLTDMLGAGFFMQAIALAARHPDRHQRVPARHDHAEPARRPGPHPARCWPSSWPRCSSGSSSAC